MLPDVEIVKSYPKCFEAGKCCPGLLDYHSIGTTPCSRYFSTCCYFPYNYSEGNIPTSLLVLVENILTSLRSSAADTGFSVFLASTTNLHTSSHRACLVSVSRLISLRFQSSTCSLCALSHLLRSLITWLFLVVTLEDSSLQSSSRERSQKGHLTELRNTFFSFHPQIDPFLVNKDDISNKAFKRSVNCKWSMSDVSFECP